MNRDVTADIRRAFSGALILLVLLFASAVTAQEATSTPEEVPEEDPVEQEASEEEGETSTSTPPEPPEEEGETSTSTPSEPPGEEETSTTTPDELPEDETATSTNATTTPEQIEKEPEPVQFGPIAPVLTPEYFALEQTFLAERDAIWLQNEQQLWDTYREVYGEDIVLWNKPDGTSEMLPLFEKKYRARADDINLLRAQAVERITYQLCNETEWKPGACAEDFQVDE